jgi:hypothetical protein
MLDLIHHSISLLLHFLLLIVQEFVDFILRWKLNILEMSVMITMLGSMRVFFVVVLVVVWIFIVWVVLHTNLVKSMTDVSSYHSHYHNDN